MIAQVRAAERVHREHAIAADQATVTEGNSGTTPTTFTVTREGHLAAGTATVSFSSPTATSADYTNATQTVTFAAGEASKQVSVNVTGDTVAEANDVVTATISPASGSVGTASASLTILDDEQSSWAIAGPAAGVAEGASGTFTVTRTGATAAATVVLNAAGGTVSAADTNFAAQTLTFASGDTSKTVNVAATQDSDLESNETLSLSITPSAGSVTTATATMTVLDDDQSNWAISTAASAVSEAVGTVALTVERTGASPAATIVLTTAGGTAVAGSDYTGATQTLTFAAGEMSKSVNVAVTDDASVEPNESFNATLSGASAGNIATSSITVEIQDNEQSVWSVAANSDSILEGAGNASFTVSRTGATAAGTIVFATAGVSATSADFTSVNQTLTFADGELSKTVTVALTGDSLLETTETFQGSIQGASSGTIATGTATVSIIDDEQDTWRISTVDNLASTSVSEGATSVAVLVTREGPASAAATIVVATGGGSATAGSDYTGVNQTLTFAAGETQKTVSIALTDDSAPEPNESFNVSISTASAGTLGSQTSVAVELTDNEQALWSVSADQASVSEAAGSAAFTVTRSGKTDVAATIVVSSVGGEATAGSDYTSVNQTLTFAAGQTQQTVQVAIGQDSNLESNETFSLTLSSPSAGNIETASASLTINDDDQSTWSIAANASTPIDEGAGSTSFTVTRSGATNNSATVQVAFGGGTANGDDYTNSIQTLTFAAGETARVISTAVTNDLLLENTETFNATLQNAGAGSTIDAAASSAAVTLLDNDNLSWTVVAANDSVNETAGTTSFTVARAGNIQQTDTIVFQTVSSTASEGSDYSPLSQTMTFAVGESSKTTIVSILNDSAGEDEENISVVINNQSNGTVIAARDGLQAGSANTLIVDDDQMGWRIAVVQAETGESAGNIGFTVTRTGSFGSTETVVVQTSGGDATAGADYTALLQTLTFAAGQTTQTVNVAVTSDFLAESNESFTATLSNASAGTLSASKVNATIVDDDNMTWTLYAPDGSNAVTSNEGAGSATVVVSRSGVISTAQTIVITTGTNTNGSAADYTPLNQTLSFAAGEASKNVPIALTDDSLGEAREALFATIHSQSAGNLGEYKLGSLSGVNAIVYLEDNDQSQWQVRAVRNFMGEDAGSAGFEVFRTGNITQAGTIVFSTAASGQAIAGSDYTPLLQTLSFSAGEASRVVTVPLTNDTLKEATESFEVFIMNPSIGAQYSADTSSALVTLIDSDSTNWRLTYELTATSEAAGVAPIRVIRQGDASAAGTVVLQTAGGTASGAGNALNGSDYTPLLQTLSFAAGETGKIVNLALSNDSAAEGDETIGLILSAPSQGLVDGAYGTLTVTVVDDDNLGWSVNALGAAGENAGQQMFWAVSRAGDSTATATIEVHTQITGSDALPGIDYTSVHRTLTFLPGQTQQVVSADVLPDTIVEAGDQSVALILSQPSAGNIAKASSGTLAINDDESDKYSLRSATGRTGVYEGDVVGIQVMREGADISTTTTVVFNLAHISTNGSDFTGPSQQTLTFAPGQLIQTVYTTLNADGLPEDVESFRAFLTGTDGSQRVGSATGLPFTLYDRDSVNWSVASGGNSNESAGNTFFKVSRSGNVTGTDTIVVESHEWNLVNSGLGNVLHTPVLRTLTFNPGEETQNVNVSLLDDAVNRSGNGSAIYLNLRNPSVGNVITASASSIQEDNDLSGALWQVTATSSVVGEGEGQAFFTVNRQGDVSQTATIEFLATDPFANANSGLANAFTGSDFAATHTTLTFLPGVSTLTQGVAIVQDNVAEASETVRVVLANPSLGMFGGSGSSGTSVSIRDDDTFTWSVAIDQATVSESSGVAIFRVGRFGAPDVTSTVVVQTYDGTAVAGVDYVALAPTTLTFTPGEVNKNISVALNAADSVLDGNKTFQLAASAFSNGISFGGAFATATLIDDDLMSWTVGRPAIETENSGFTLVRVARSGDISTAETVVLTTGSGTAARGVNYTDASQTLSFAAGQASQVVRVALADNTDNAEPLTGTTYSGTNFVASLSQASKGVLATADSSFIIYDTDQGNNISIGNQVGSETTGQLSYELLRSGSYAATETVVVRLRSTSVESTEGVDFNAYAQTVTFTPGEYVKRVAASNVFVNDSTPENEGYALFIESVNGGSNQASSSGAANAVIFHDSDDSQWAITASAAPTYEGFVNDGAFAVTRVGDLSQAATVVVQSVGGTAQAGVDYTPLLQTLTFAAGANRLNVILSTLDDSQREVGETVTAAIVGMSTGRTVSGQSVATFTIADNDFDRMVWNVGTAGGVNEAAGVASFAIGRTSANSTGTVVYQTSATTALAGSDYVALAPTTLTFGVGELRKVVNVTVNTDTTAEIDETVQLVIHSPSMGVISTASSTAVIYNDDSGPLFSFETPSGIVEPESGSNTGYFGVLRTRDLSQTDTIVLEIAWASTATEGSDFSSTTARTLTFAPGQTRAFATVDVLADTLVEGNETVVASIGKQSRGNLGAVSATLTITDAEMPMTWAVAATAAGTESATGVSTVTVSRSGNIGVASTVVVQTNGAGTATPGTDFTALAPTTLTFAAGETTRYVPISLLADTLSEATETIGVSLSNFSHGTGPSSTTVGISDDDRLEWSVLGAANALDDASNALVWKVVRNTQGSAMDSTETVVVQTMGGTAWGGSDFTVVAPTTLTFAAGETEKIVTTAVLPDAVVEGAESVLLGISDVSRGQVLTSSAGLTILETDNRVEWTMVAGNAVLEGNRAQLSVTRANDYSTTETVVVNLVGGTATQGVDFTAVTAQTLTFAPGDTRQVFTVSTNTDTLVEANETIIASIASVSRGHVLTSAATTTINDNDSTRTMLAIASQGAVDERGGVVGWTVNRTGDLTVTTTVEYVLGNGTAAAAVNNTSASVGTVLGTLTFNPGEASKGVSIPLLDDGVVEANGSLAMNIQNASNGIITTGTVTTAVNDAQAAAAATSFTVAGTNTLDTNGSVLFTITRTGNVSGASVVNYQTGTAGTLASGSFVAEGPTALTFAAGETVKTVAVALVDGSSTGTLQLQVDGNNDSTFSGTAPDVNATATITNAAAANNSWAMALTATSQAFEGTGAPVVVQITRTGDLTVAATLAIEAGSVAGTATATTDYVSAGLTTVTFAAGEAVKSVAVATLVNDSAVELGETLIVSANSQTGGSATLPANLTFTILDDETLVGTSGADTITLNNANGFGAGVPVGYLVDAGGGADNITLATVGVAWGDVQAGAGNDTVNLATGGTGSAMFVAGAHINGGADMDTLNFAGATTTLNLRALTVNGTATGFEVVNLTGTGNNTLTLGVADLLDLTTGNAVARELRIDGNAGDVLNLAGLGVTGQSGGLAPVFSTPTAGTTITDVDNVTTGNVVASAAGDANANDVTLGANVYDVYQFNTTAGTFTLLVDTDMTKTFIA